MVFGIILIVLGYALFYWGMHHFESTDPTGHPWPRYSLTCLLGLNKFNLPSFQPLQYDVPNIPPSDQTTTTPGGAVNPQGNTTTPTPQGTTPTGQLGKAPQNWQNDILSAISAPASKNNIYKLTNWNLCEGNANGLSGLPINNAFNTTCVCCGGTPVPGNTASVKIYPTWSDGVQATAHTLQTHKGILNNLVSDGTLQDFVYAFQNEPPGTQWGTSPICLASRLLNQ